MEKCDILCLVETWLRPDELHVIETIINNCAELKDDNFSVFAKSSMGDVDGAYRGRPLVAWLLYVNSLRRLPSMNLLLHAIPSRP